jgi:hypothetical protein
MPGEVSQTRHPIERRDSGDGDLEPPEWARRRIRDYHLPPLEERRRDKGGQ